MELIPGLHTDFVFIRLGVRPPVRPQIHPAHIRAPIHPSHPKPTQPTHPTHPNHPTHPIPSYPPNSPNALHTSYPILSTQLAQCTPHILPHPFHPIRFNQQSIMHCPNFYLGRYANPINPTPDSALHEQKTTVRPK